jgi:hypothetical protein
VSDREGVVALVAALVLIVGMLLAVPDGPSEAPASSTVVRLR